MALHRLGHDSGDTENDGCAQACVVKLLLLSGSWHYLR